jgi:hypothetical protein
MGVALGNSQEWLCHVGRAKARPDKAGEMAVYSAD